MDDRAVRFYNRATILFVLLAVVAAIGLVVLVSLETWWPVRAFLLTADGLVIAGSALLIRGLDHDRPWAVPATVLACWLLVVTGVVQVIYDLTHSTITIPLAAIGAAIVLLEDPRPDAGRRIAFTKPVVAVTLALGVGLAGPAVAAAAVTGAGAMLSLHPNDIAMDVHVTCADDAASGQGSATITADWHWSRSEWFPGGNDAVVIRWSGPDESGAESFTLADVPPIEMGTGMWHGSADPSAARAAALEVESPSVVIGIDLAQQRYADGHVVVTLSPRSRLGGAWPARRRVHVRASRCLAAAVRGCALRVVSAGGQPAVASGSGSRPRR